MRIFNKVVIVGTGLIGGSIALAIKKKNLAREVIGISRRRKSLFLAEKKGAIDTGSLSLDIAKAADLLILATPVNTIMSLARKISRIISSDCIVTDVGSTKKEVSSVLDRLFPNYVGSHPLAGSEKRSIINARADIFKGSLCVLTPTKNTHRQTLKKIKLFWERIGARVVLLGPENHDRALAFVSHLPHIIAFSLINTVPNKYLKLSSTGFRDTTRIAASDSEIWSDIFLSNRRNVLNTLDLLEKDLSRIKSLIQKRDRRSLALMIKKAKARRESLA